MSEIGLSDLLPTLDSSVTLIFAAIFLFAGIIKGFLGIGLPAAAMGLLTLLVPPTEAIPLLWLPILGTNILQFAHAPQKREIVSEYFWFAIAIIVAIFITSMFMSDYPTALLTVSIGIAMVVFSLNLLLGLTLPVGTGQVWQVGAGLLAGVLGGLSSIWSPIVAIYLVARNVPKERFIGVTGFLFLAGCLPLGASIHRRIDHRSGTSEIVDRISGRVAGIPYRRGIAQTGVPGTVQEGCSVRLPDHGYSPHRNRCHVIDV